MPKSDGPLEKVTLKLYPGDFARLRDFFPEIGASIVVRKLVRNYVQKLEGDTEVPKIDVEI